MNTEMLPCPFCGSNKLKIDKHKCKSHYGGTCYSLSIRCNKCHARSPSLGVNISDNECIRLEDYEEKLIEKWNNRIELHNKEKNCEHRT